MTPILWTHTIRNQETDSNKESSQTMSTEAYLLSFLPAFLFPESKCLGFISNTCRSDSPFFPKRFIFFWAFFIIVLAFFTILTSRRPETSRGVREQLRLRTTEDGGTDSSAFFSWWHSEISLPGLRSGHCLYYPCQHQDYASHSPNLSSEPS